MHCCLVCQYFRGTLVQRVLDESPPVCNSHHMPRSARLDAPGVLHHVMGRGIEKKDIFYDDGDRDDFIERLSSLALDGALDAYAWALMPNHFHLLVKTGLRPLASSMRKLMTGYAVRFNRRHDRYGHLFQNRYKSIVCQEEAYLKELVRYIHLNPVRSKLVSDIEMLGDYPWTGHAAIIDRIKRKWQDTSYVLSYFGKRRYARKRYLQYVAAGVNQGKRPELVGGGLIRSMGGWSEVLSMRKRGGKAAYDQRILGDGEFVEQIIGDRDDMVKKNLRLSGQRIDIDALSDMICSRFGVSPGELRSGSRRHKVVDARREMAWIAVRELGYSGAEVARFLGVTTSCINRSVASRTDKVKLKIDLKELVGRHELCAPTSP